MCRFLMIKSQLPYQAADALSKFAVMAEQSRAPDGDRQADGWGVGWLDQGGSWQVRKSLRPIWQETDALSQFPASPLFLAHARSASFPHQRDVLEYNQPYFNESYGFVFNGLLEGVAFPFPVGGRIGSQKIWRLLSAGLGRSSPEESLMELAGDLERCSRRVQALNIGLGGQDRLYAYCQYEGEGGYYQLQFLDSPDLQMVCSEALAGFDFQPVPRGRVLRL
jgi:hypothetical protein